MAMDLGGIFAAIEHSALGAVARDTVWLYPLANVVHILALMAFAAPVVVLDLRVFGAFARIPPGEVMRPARRAAIVALAVLALSGAVMFASEAAKLGAHTVFQAKAVMLAAALGNAALFQWLWARRIAEAEGGAALPLGARAMAALSVVLWLCVAAAGRLIAYS